MFSRFNQYYKFTIAQVVKYQKIIIKNWELISIMKKKPKFYTAEEIRRMVLQEKRLPAITGNGCDDFIVKSRNPIGSRKDKNIKYK